MLGEIWNIQNTRILKILQIRAFLPAHGSMPCLSILTLPQNILTASAGNPLLFNAVRVNKRGSSQSL